MAIVTRVPELIAEEFGGRDLVNILQVQQRVGLNYKAVERWIDGKVSRFDAKAIEAWCDYFNLSICELLVRVADSEVADTNNRSLEDEEASLSHEPV